MPILDIAHGLRRVGKLRLGTTVEATKQDGTPTTRPAKLENWRATSGDRVALNTVAAAFGGTVEPWDNDGNAEFEVITDTPVLDVLIPTGGDVFSQFYELWSGGGCQRRCDGFAEQLSGDACKCPADREERSRQAKLLKPTACKATTRLSVILPKVAALGVWQMETHGFYGAKELASTFELLELCGARERLLPARLRIEQRVSKKPGEKPNHYGVPVLDIGMSFESLLGGLELVAPPGVDLATGEITGPKQRELPPAEDESEPAQPVTSAKKAGARKAAAAKKAAPPVDDTPMTPEEIAAVRARVALLDREHQSLNAQLMNNARITLKGGPPKRSEAASIETILSSVEAKQAEAWEDRRKRVFAALEEYGFDDEQRHTFIADATSELGEADGGPTESTKTLTEAQATTIIVAAGGEPEQQTIGEAAS